MKRGPGRPRKVVEPEVSGTIDADNLKNTIESEENIHGEEKKEEKPELVLKEKIQTDVERIAESRKVLDVPLPTGQKFFETPDGEILVGEASKDQMWSRRLNNGKGGWVNPKR